MSFQSWRRNWVAEKSQMAIRLSCGEAGGGYAEAVILICAVLSALSAELWSGRHIDRARFVEMLVRVGPYAGDCATISVPLLAQYLDDSSRKADALQMRRAFSIPSISRVLTGPEVDKSEQEIFSLFPQLKPKEVRRFSYASILYSEVRSSYVHEYQPGRLAASRAMTMLADQKVSYSNRLTEGLDTYRLVYFHVEWLAQLAIELASTIDNSATSLPKPSVWWVEGG